MLLHRNIECQQGNVYSHVVIENIIDRGTRNDWGQLLKAMRTNETTFRRVKETAEAFREHPFSGRFVFWGKLCQKIKERKNAMARKPYQPEWEELLSAAAHTGHIVPESVLAGGTACALYAQHRFSSKT